MYESMRDDRAENRGQDADPEGQQAKNQVRDAESARHCTELRVMREREKDDRMRPQRRGSRGKSYEATVMREGEKGRIVRIHKHPRSPDQAAAVARAGAASVSRPPVVVASAFAPKARQSLGQARTCPRQDRRETSSQMKEGQTPRPHWGGVRGCALPRPFRPGPNARPRERPRMPRVAPRHCLREGWPVVVAAAIAVVAGGGTQSAPLASVALCVGGWVGGWMCACVAVAMCMWVYVRCVSNLSAWANARPRERPRMRRVPPPPHCLREGWPVVAVVGVRVVADDGTQSAPLVSVALCVGVRVGVCVRVWQCREGTGVRYS